MDFTSIITHMNDHHTNELIGLVKKFGGKSDPKDVKLEGVDFEGLDIAYAGGSVRVEFPQKASPDTIKKRHYLTMYERRADTRSSGH